MINKTSAARCCTMLHMSKLLSPPSLPSRVSVPITPEVLSTFQRLAKAGNMSTGRAMGEWLADTVEAAQMMALTMERARAAPKVVIQELQAYSLGMSEELSGIMDKLRKKGEADRAEAGRRGAPAPLRAAAGLAAVGSPPSCNTGGKVPEQGKRVRRGKSS